MPNYVLPQEWALEKCKVKEAWDLSLPNHGLGKRKGEGIVIVHPDTGWTIHPELIKGERYLMDMDKNYYGIFMENFDAEDILTGRFPGHGTSTASVMMSEEGHPSLPPNPFYPSYTVPPEQFVTGVAPKVEVIPVRVTDNVFIGTFLDRENLLPVNTYASLAKALYYALSLNNDRVGVISISLGGIGNPDNVTKALKECRRAGVIICAAAGQLPGKPEFIKKEPTFPGNSPHTIGVAGCDKDFKAPPEGFYGTAVDITTPGWGLYAAETKKIRFNIRTYTMKNGNADGTSYATAFTAGACALWQAYHSRPLLINKYGRPFLLDVFRYCLANSCFKPPNWDSYNRGMGILDVEKLLKVPLPSVSTVEIVARSNNWTEADWGDPKDWGRESL